MNPFSGKIPVILLALFLVCLVSPGLSQEREGDETAKIQQEIEALKARIEALQKALDELRAGEQMSQEDQNLLKELEQELQAQAGSKEQGPPQVSDQTQQARKQFFQGMNPNISTIGGLFGSASGEKALERQYDFGLEEVEFAFIAAVDPYARGDFYVHFGSHDEALTPGTEAGHADDPGHDEVGHTDETHGLQPEIEEAYLTLLTLPNAMQLKAGRFRSKIGKINETHPHAYDFIGLPLVHRNFLGPEGLAGEGVGLKWLLPNRRFFQELSLQVISNPGESASFLRAHDETFLYLAHLTNFFDLTESTSLEIGLAGATGPHSEEGERTNLLAADLTLKWKPLRYNRYKSFTWQTEALYSQRKEPVGDIKSVGLFSHLRYQIAKRWFLGYLFDYSEFPEFSEYRHKAHSGIVQFLATEFQKFELQFQYNDGNFFDSYAEAKLRAVFVIGAHGAHQY